MEPNPDGIFPSAPWQRPSVSILQNFFSSKIAEALIQAPWTDATEVSFEVWVNRVITDTLGHKLHGGLVALNECPDSIQQFLEVAELVLHPSVFKEAYRNLYSFDELAGISCAEEFIQNYEIGDWLCLAWRQLLQFEKPTSVIASKPPKAAIVTRQRKRQPEPSEAEEKAMIRQVRLKGPTIRQAWFDNKQLRDLEPSTHFTPEEFGGYDVFHGTDHQLNSPIWCKVWNDTPFSLVAFQTMNQMAPPVLPVAFTSFSPLRAFLWATFKSNLYLNVPNQQMQTKKWSVQGTQYEGLAVFQFRSQQPKMPGLSSYSVPKGKEEEWANAVKLMYGVASNKYWSSLRKFHNDESEEWPEMVHGREYG
jgi:hypothetical protein